MKTMTSKMLGMLLVAVLFVLTACSKNDDPADNSLFTGQYHGSATYISGDTNVNNSDAVITVVKVGNNYNFDFPGDIPNLTNISMSEGDNNTLFLSDGQFGTIRITASSLNIAFTRDGAAWTATAERR